MIHRSSSSRRRKPARTTTVSPHRSTGSLNRKSTASAPGSITPTNAPNTPDENVDSTEKAEKLFRKPSLGSSSGSKIRTTASGLPTSAGAVSEITAEYSPGFRGSITVTDADDQDRSSTFPIRSPEYGSVEVKPIIGGGCSKDDFSRSPRGSVSYETLRSRTSGIQETDILGPKAGHASSMITRKSSRSSLIPEPPVKSPRNSLVPEDAYSGSRSARGSIDPSQLSRGSRSSLLPDVESFSRSSRPSLIADVGALYGSNSSGYRNTLDSSPNRSPRNSLIPDRGASGIDITIRASRTSLAPDVNRTPRGSLVPEVNKSPRSSLVPECSKTPRGSLVAEPFCSSGRTPRGSVTSEGALYTYSRSSRSSLPFQDVASNMSQGKSPRGSVASGSAVQFDLTVRTPRGSIESAPPMGSKDKDSNERLTATYRAGSLRGTIGTASTAPVTSIVVDTEVSRRASSNVSQVSSDDRRHLCEHTKLNQEAGLGLTAYGSFMYQLNHANMESSGVCDFVVRALRIVYRTVLVTVLLACLLFLPIVMLVMGVEYVKDCPKEPKIPLYMIVGGCFGLIMVCLILWHQVRSLRYERLSHPKDSSQRDDNDDFLTTSAGTKMAYVGLAVFLIVWFVLGNHWIFSIYMPEFEQPSIYQPDSWCHKSLYIFSLVHLIIMYTIVAVILLLVITLALFQVCFLRCR